ncbi:MAG: type 4a pilus biogenesis protein PilO [Deltaproteobacteria bacterium]|nr:type 4a pilus biogenesis protein PilO [Deltaproteobacteria bacterium]
MNLRDMKIKKFPLLKEGIVLTLFFAVITLVFNILFYSPSKKEIKGLKVEIEKLNSNINDYQAVASSAGNESKRLMDVEKAYQEMESRLLFSKEQIPSEKEVSSILKELSSPNPGLTLVNIQTSPLEDKGEYSRLPLVLQLQGGFQSLGTYLVSLENSRRLIGIENINLVKEEQAGVSIRMELNLFLMKEGAV